MHPDTIDDMPSSLFYDYLRAIDIIKAENTLIALEIANFPNIKKAKDKADIVNRYKKMAQLKKETVTGHEMARKLSEWRVKK